METNYNTKPTLNELSEYLGLTPQYLSKFIKEQMNTSYNNYLNSVRMNHALTELIHTNNSITEISFNNGFPNLTSFNKNFFPIL